MSEILDHIEKKNQKRTFSKASLIMSLITLGLFIYLGSLIPGVIKASEGSPLTLPTLIYMSGAILVSSVIGIVITIWSFVKKESNSWYKWLGGILNILFFLFLIVSVVFLR